MTEDSFTNQSDFSFVSTSEKPKQISDNNSYIQVDNFDPRLVAEMKNRKSFRTNTTDYQQKGSVDSKSMIMTVTDEGEKKLNVMQMVTMLRTNPKGLVQEVLRLPLKQLFWKRIRYRNLRSLIVIFTVALALQLRFSRRARSHAKRMSLALFFGVTFFGFLATVALLFIKLKLHKKHQRQLTLNHQSS